MRRHLNRGITSTEILIAVVLAVIAFAMNSDNRVVSDAQMTKQIGNVKHITLACQLFASDHGGNFPDGNYDPTLKKIVGGSPATTAETCFNDLIKSKSLDVEKIYWSPHHTGQCSPHPPDENGTLIGSENCWDYISGLTNSSDPNLPLTFEASAAGSAMTWSTAKGHPWKAHVILGYVDGSAEKRTLTADNEAITDRDGTKIHLCLPTPGKNNWPESAKLAPATPVD